MNRVEQFNELVRKLNAAEPDKTQLQEVAPKTDVSESDINILQRAFESIK